MAKPKHYAHPGSSFSKGLTLVELLVALTIIGILAVIAYPSYLDQVRKSRRAVAKSALLDAANREEQYFFSHRDYTLDVDGLGYSSAFFGKDSTNLDGNTDAVYLLSVAALDNADCGTSTEACFKLKAVAQNDQANDTDCYTFYLTSNNAKTSTDVGGTPTTSCW